MLRDWNENSPNVLNQIFLDIDDIREKLNTLRGEWLNIRGIITMWSGYLSEIPEGWALCDGSNGTPDLRDTFVVGAGRDYMVGNTGGENEVTLTVNQIPSHNHSMGSAGSHSHSGSTNSTGSHTHPYTDYYSTGSTKTGMGGSSGRKSQVSTTRTTASSGSHSHSVTTSSVGSHTHTINNRGGGQPHENRPPYFALAFIMKL